MKFRLTIILLLFQNSSYSCETEFQELLLSNRQATMQKSPIGMFHEKISEWSNEFNALNLPVDDNDGEPEYWINGKTRNEIERKNIETKYLSRKQMQLVEQARKSGSYEEAKEILKNESGAFVDYTLAVLNWNYDETNENPIDNRYNLVPKPDLAFKNEPWRLWGLYMLGIKQLQYLYEDYAIETFQQVQDLVESGLDDPLHVAVSSLGYQALAYQRTDQFDKATEAYLKLVKLGHSYASYWLKEYARSLVFSYEQLWRSGENETDEDKQYHINRLLQAIQQPLTRRLLITYAYTHLNYDQHSMFQAILKTSNYTSEESGLLAAYAYRLGHYEDAEKLAKLNQTQLSQLILAKLLIRKGDKNQAAVIYSNLISKLKDLSFNQLSPESCMIIAENSVLAMSEGNISEAFDILINQTGGEYWQDIAYISEQLLPLDTLIAKIKSLKNNPPPLKAGVDGYVLSNSNIYGQSVFGIKNDPVKALIYLTGRRMIRENQEDLAMEFMPNDSLKEKLKKYIEIKKSIDSSTNNSEKAAMKFKQAEWIIKNGSQLLAFEGRPDWKMFHMNYINYKENFKINESESNSSKINWVHNKEKSLLEKTNNFPYPNKNRFSYRYKAVEIAREAANLLEYSNPNYENYLCYATKWILNTDEKIGRGIFKEFIRNAKPKEDRKYFGSKCNKVN